MAKFATIQNNFTAGEIDKKLDGRTDITNYKNGVDEMENMLPQYFGGATRRMGSRIQRVGVSAPARSEDNLKRFIPYTWSGAGNSVGPFDFIVSIDSAQTTKVQVDIANTPGARTVILSGTSSNNFLVSGTTDDYDIDYAQVGNLLFMSHKSGFYQPLVGFINPANVSEFLIIPFLDEAFIQSVGAGVHDVLRRPYTAPNVDKIFLKSSAVSGTGVTLTSWTDSGATVAKTDFFTTFSVGQYYRLTIGAQEAVLKVTAYTSGGSVTADVRTPLLAGSGNMNVGATTATDNWSVSDWDAINGYPRTVTAHENRLYWGGNIKEADHIWTTSYENLFRVAQNKLVQDVGASADVSGLRYFGEILDSDPFDFYVNNREFNSIRWIVGGRSLLIGTSLGEFVADGGNEVMSRTNVPFVKNISKAGSCNVRPAPFRNGVVFVAKDERRLREFTYSEENGSYVSRDINILAPDIASYQALFTAQDWYSVTIIDIAYDTRRHVMWALTNLGTLVAITYNKEAQVEAWSKHYIGGVYGFNTFAKVTGIASVPNDDDIYVSVLRTVNSADKWTMEVIGKEFENIDLDNTTEPAYYMDCAERIQLSSEFFGSFFIDTDVTVGTDTINLPFHQFRTGDKCELFLNFGATALPAPLLTSTTYYIIRVDANNFKFATTEANADAGTAIDITDVGTLAGGEYGISITARKRWGNFDHLIDQEVCFLIEGRIGTSQTVDSNGEILFSDYSVTAFTMGICYQSRVVTKNINAGLNYETAIGAIKRLDRVIVRFYKSYYAEINAKDPSDFGLYKEMDFTDQDQGASLLLYTGEKNIYIEHDPETEARVGLRTDKPTPMTITSLIMRGKTYE